MLVYLQLEACLKAVDVFGFFLLHYMHEHIAGRVEATYNNVVKYMLNSDV